MRCLPAATQWRALRGWRPCRLPQPIHSRARHAGGIETISLRRDHPIPALALAMWLQALAEHCGARLLRLKGLVEVDEQPNRPAIIHAFQHVVSPPEWLPQWPSADHSTRIVIIGEGIPGVLPRQTSRGHRRRSARDNDRRRDRLKPQATVIRVFTELAMKQASCASWCICSSFVGSGASPVHSIFG